MTFIDRDGEPANGDYPVGDYRVFERILLSSARADGPPPEAAQQAWAKFTIALGAAAAVTPVAAGGLASLSRWSRLTRTGALKWLVLGAVGGSGLTVVWMRTQSGAEKPAPALFTKPPDPSLATDHARPGGSEPPIRGPAPAVFPNGNRPNGRQADTEPTRGTAAETNSGTSKTTRHRQHHAVSRGGSVPGRETSQFEPPSEPPRTTEEVRRSMRASTLAAEVALLDTARDAISKGDFAAALHLVRRYRADFPSGELALDVDVVAIEALAAQRNWAEVAVQGRRFLERHPQDPQVTRIRALVGH